MKRTSGYYIYNDKLVFIHPRSLNLVFTVEPDFPAPGEEIETDQLLSVGYDWESVVKNLVLGSTRFRVMEWQSFIHETAVQVVADLENYLLDQMDYEDDLEDDNDLSLYDEDEKQIKLTWNETISKQAVLYIIEYLCTSSWFKQREIREQGIRVTSCLITNYDIEYTKTLLLNKFQQFVEVDNPNIFHIAEFVSRGIKEILPIVVDLVKKNGE